VLQHFEVLPRRVQDRERIGLDRQRIGKPCVSNGNIHTSQAQSCRRLPWQP
jgi:hypothetical protein